MKYNTIEEMTLSSLKDIPGLVMKSKDKCIFRGVSNIDYELIPKIARNGKDWSKLEDILDDEFVKYAEEFMKTDNPDKNKITAQHYGLPTRLLDWTEKLLVALFFACNDDYESDGAIYTLTKTAFDPCYILEKEPGCQVCMLTPKNITKRVIVQSGCFTYSKDPLECIAKYIDKYNGSLSEDRLKIRMEMIIIPFSLKKKIMKYLDYQRVNYYTLFPDLDGVSKYLEWKFIKGERK